jgi:hypothetical protein
MKKMINEKCNRMNNILFASICVLLIPMVSIAEPVVLKCHTSKNHEASDLVIDLSKKVMSWGSTIYRIHHFDDTYISAYEEQYYLGGEVWVINRITGEYHRAAVGIFHNENEEQGKLKALTFSGFCKRTQF